MDYYRHAKQKYLEKQQMMKETMENPAVPAPDNQYAFKNTQNFSLQSDKIQMRQKPKKEPSFNNKGFKTVSDSLSPTNAG